MAFVPWYKEMSVYHIWLRSFCDGNGFTARPYELRVYSRGWAHGSNE